MKFYIELLIPAIMFIIFITWLVYIWVTKKIHERRYKPENDKGYQGEENRKRLIAERGADPIRKITNSITGSREGINNDEGQGEPEGRDNIQAADVDVNGEAGSGSGKSVKPRRKFRNPFKRR